MLVDISEFFFFINIAVPLFLFSTFQMPILFLAGVVLVCRVFPFFPPPT